jgi:hypothetical protein
MRGWITEKVLSSFVGAVAALLGYEGMFTIGIRSELVSNKVLKAKSWELGVIIFEGRRTSRNAAFPYCF